MRGWPAMPSAIDQRHRRIIRRCGRGWSNWRTCVVAFGYRCLHDLLRLEFIPVNHKRIERLYRQANLAVRKRRKANPNYGAAALTVRQRAQCDLKAWSSQRRVVQRTLPEVPDYRRRLHH
jgi:hypothetical protein